MGYTPCFWVREEKEKNLAELISWTHKNEQIGVSFGWANHSLTYKALGQEESPLFPLEDFQATVMAVTLSFQSWVWWMWSYFGMSVWKAFSDYTGVIEWRSETRQLCLSPFAKTRFADSIISEWDNSTGLGMKRVSVLERRCCLWAWQRAIGEQGLRAAAGHCPPYSHFPHSWNASPALSLYKSDFSPSALKG